MSLEMLELVVHRVSFMLILFFIITRNKLFKDVLQKEEYNKKDLNKIGIIFGFLAIIPSYYSINSVYGEISLIRNITIISGTLLFGRRVGLIASCMTLVHWLSINSYVISLGTEILNLVLTSMMAIMLQPKIKKDKKVVCSILIGAIGSSVNLLYLLIYERESILFRVYIQHYIVALIVGCIGMVLFISILQDIQNERVLSQKEKEIERLKVKSSKLEFKALQSQINPHFLFNTLNAISILIKKNPDEARRLIHKFAYYLRYNLELKSGLINIKKELEQTKVYIEIESVRFKDKLDIIYDIDKDIDVKIPSLIIQPIVENAIVHGILKSKSKCKLMIAIKRKDNNVKVTVENEGVPISEKIIDGIINEDIKEDKIGLYNVHCRLKCQYGRGLDITRLDNGTRVEFQVGGD